MEDQKILLQKIVEGIQEKKGKKIITADLSAIDSASAEYFIICEGGSTMQVSAIADNIRELNRSDMMDIKIHNGSFWITEIFMFTFFFLNIGNIIN